MNKQLIQYIIIFISFIFFLFLLSLWVPLVVTPNFSSILLSTLFWQIVGTFGSIVALLLIFKQIYETRNIAAYEFIINARKNFYSDDLMKKRALMSRELLKKTRDFERLQNLSETNLLFFEEIGLLLRKIGSSGFIIWTVLGDNIIYYWQILKKHIKWYRKKMDDDTLYSEFQRAYHIMEKYEKKYRYKKEHPEGKKQEEFKIKDSVLKKFLLDEMIISFYKSDEISLKKIV